MSNYWIGSDLLGAPLVDEPVIGVVEQGGPVLTIRVRDVEKLVAAKGGEAGKLLYQGAPQAMTNKVYSDMGDKISSGMKAEGVDAEVKVVSSAPPGGSVARDLYTGMGLGVVGVGAVYGLVRLAKHFIGGR